MASGPAREGTSFVGYGSGTSQSPLPAPPTQARGVEKRDRLYAAAMARYREAGVADTRVEDVIADAEVSWATFFRYFPRKEDVLLEGAARHFRDRVRAVAEQGLEDGRLRIRTVVERTFAALLEPADMARALHNAALLEVFASPSRFAALVGDQPQPVIGLVAELLAEGQRRGEVQGGRRRGRRRGGADRRVHVPGGPGGRRRGRWRRERHAGDRHLVGRAGMRRPHPGALASCSGVLAIASGFGAGQALAASNGKLMVSPAKGTPDASPQTQISVLGVAPRRIRSVKVTGSVTGEHRGSLHDYSSSRGASFVPDQPFAQGERVKLVVRVRHRKPVRRTFTIAQLGPVQPVLNLKQQQPDKLQHFVSKPELLPPRIDINKDTGGTRGRVFLTPLPSPVVHPDSHNTIEIHPVGPGGPMITDGNGKLVWFKQLDPPEVAANLRIQKFGGRKVLTWWQGGVTPSAFGIGKGVIANRSYKTIRTVHAGNGYDMDIHEFTLTPGGNALLTVYVPIMVHLPGSPSGTLSPLLDSLVQEVDVRTGLVVWEWHSYGHIPLADSYATPENSASYDAYHINSIQHLKHGCVLVSERDTSAVYKIDRATGRIRWTLGGKANDFQHRHDARFWLQHDAQLLPGHRIGLFDDEAGPPKKGPYSRGLILDLNMRQRSAKVARQYYRSTTTSAQSEGSLQTRGSGNVFVGFGSEPFFSQFSQGGRLLYDGSLPKDDGSYRTFRYRWHGDPRTRPTLAVQLISSSKVAAFASWNGATAVRRWQLLAGPDEDKLRPIGSGSSTGFETEIDANRAGQVFAVRAIDSHGHVLASSNAVSPS